MHNRKIFIFLILFIQGINGALPVTDLSLPFWAKRISLAGDFELDNILFVLFLVYFLVTTKKYILKGSRDMFICATILICFFLVGILSSAANSQPIKDMGEAMRFVYWALYLFIMLNEMSNLSAPFLLRSFLTGAFTGGIVNTIYTLILSNNFIGNSILPTLLGQDGPGTVFGICVLLSCWLMLIRESPYDIVLSILILVIFSFNALISYSKGGIILMAIGWLSWLFYILLQISLTKKTKLVAIFLLMMIVLFVRDDGRLLQYRDSITTLLNFKFGNIKPEDNNAIRERLGYFTATKEIFFTSPLLGVGYSGFYDAVTRTKAYAKGLTPKEDANANSHPHNTFLYYIAVNGILGALLSVFFFFFMISLIIRHMRDYNTFGKIFGSLLILSLFLVGSTTIWLFNGPIPILIFTILLHHQLIKKGMLPKNNYS